LCLELLDGQFDKRVLREEGESLPEGNPFGSFLSVKLLQKSEEVRGVRYSFWKNIDTVALEMNIGRDTYFD
jgi:hypothetical protein